MLEQAISRKPLQHPQTKSGAADSASGKCQAGNIIKRRSGRDFAPITAAAQFPNLTELDLCDSIEVGHRQLQWNPAQTSCRAGPRAPRLTDADVDTEIQPILLASLSWSGACYFEGSGIYFVQRSAQSQLKNQTLCRLGDPRLRRELPCQHDVRWR